ncbi:MAG: type II toxin-antitoxin system Phd/YefM family antitoxin [Methylococcaceae bacterium]|nr:MAG: type II toxin-antitoxin system Phd/YefM family antitoxin [Methylococcaceae bacterium]
MNSISVNQFRDNLKNLVDQAVDQHLPLKVTRRSGADFMVIGAQDWEREQETLYVLQNTRLMQQIDAALKTHAQATGYTPTAEEMHEIAGL